MKHISIWTDTASHALQFSTLNENIEADVVIIGGGITGLTSAYLLQAAGKKVVVLEALQIGSGTTGHSTGNLYVTVDENLNTVRSKYNDEVMRTVVASRAAAISEIERIISETGISCGFRRTRFSMFAEKTDDEMDHLIVRELEAMHAAGLNPRLTADIGVPFTVRKAITIENQAQMHPLQYVQQLAEHMRGKCDIYENTPATDIDVKNSVIKTTSGSVKAKYILMATHTPKGLWMVQTLLGPYREHAVAASLKSSCPDGIFWSVNHPRRSIRTYRNRDRQYVMVVGDKYKTGQGNDTKEYVQQLERYLSSRFEIGSDRYTWGGQQYRPADGLPYIGRHSDHMYFMTGFSSDGLVYGTLAAMIVSQQVLGNAHPFEHVYRYKRFTPLKSYKEFFRENANDVAQYFRRTPKAADALYREVNPGEGKVLNVGGEKVAVYKDDKGLVHAVSAVCPHMKCVVNFNPAEKTWDCPCHGSRFTISGQVLEGPSLSNLSEFRGKK